MIYQLPNGKIIEISVEQYLDMSDAELNYLANGNFGDYTSGNPFYGSVIKKSTREKSFFNELDYSVEDDSIIPNSKDNSVQEEPLDDFPDDEGDVIDS